jgi:hypothetical protein
MNVKTMRLANTNYNRPKYTIQDKLSKDDIEEKLEDYKEVDNVADIPIGCHVRYFTEVITDKKNNKSEKKFRLGGLLTNKDHPNEYIILSNGLTSWSVQVKKSTFYRKMTIEEIRDDYEMMIMELQEEIKKLKKEIKTLKR